MSCFKCVLVSFKRFNSHRMPSLPRKSAALVCPSLFLVAAALVSVALSTKYWVILDNSGDHDGIFNVDILEEEVNIKVVRALFFFALISYGICSCLLAHFLCKHRTLTRRDLSIRYLMACSLAAVLEMIAVGEFMKIANQLGVSYSYGISFHLAWASALCIFLGGLFHFYRYGRKKRSASRGGRPREVQTPASNIATPQCTDDPDPNVVLDPNALGRQIFWGNQIPMRDPNSLLRDSFWGNQIPLRDPNNTRINQNANNFTLNNLILNPLPMNYSNGLSGMLNNSNGMNSSHLMNNSNMNNSAVLGEPPSYEMHLNPLNRLNMDDPPNYYEHPNSMNIPVGSAHQSSMNRSDYDAHLNCMNRINQERSNPSNCARRADMTSSMNEQDCVEQPRQMIRNIYQLSDTVSSDDWGDPPSYMSDPDSDEHQHSMNNPDSNEPHSNEHQNSMNNPNSVDHQNSINNPDSVDHQNSMNNPNSVEHQNSMNNPDSVEHQNSINNPDSVDHQNSMNNPDSVEHQNSMNNPDSVEHQNSMNNPDSVEHQNSMNNQNDHEGSNKTITSL